MVKIHYFNIFFRLTFADICNGSSQLCTCRPFSFPNTSFLSLSSSIHRLPLLFPVFLFFLFFLFLPLRYHPSLLPFPVALFHLQLPSFSYLPPSPFLLFLFPYILALPFSLLIVAPSRLLNSYPSPSSFLLPLSFIQCPPIPLLFPSLRIFRSLPLLSLEGGRVHEVVVDFAVARRCLPFVVVLLGPP